MSSYAELTALSQLRVGLPNTEYPEIFLIYYYIMGKIRKLNYSDMWRYQSINPAEMRDRMFTWGLKALLMYFVVESMLGNRHSQIN